MNTFNVCIGHQLFPESCAEFYDLCLMPQWIKADRKLLVVNPELFGIHGATLGEFAQLIWLFRHAPVFLKQVEYVKIFHYRRFCSKTRFSNKVSPNYPNQWFVSEADLPLYQHEFNRQSEHELFLHPMRVATGLLGQYVRAHAYEDFYHFIRFLSVKKLVSMQHVNQFLLANELIPAGAVGTYRVSTFLKIFSIVEKAVMFLYHPNYIPRKDYQKRNMAFLIERLISILLFDHLQTHPIPQFGMHLLINDGETTTPSS